MLKLYYRFIVVAPFTTVPGEENINRFYFLASKLAETAPVLVITSKFNHTHKSFNRNAFYEVSPNFDICCLGEIGYSKNISIKRSISHLLFTLNLILFLINNRRLLYNSSVISAYPLLLSNIFLGILKKFYGFRLVVDINDLWPEAFKVVLPNKLHFVVENFFTSFFQRLSLQSVDGLTSVSEEYLTYMSRFVGLNVKKKVLYLGSIFKKSDFIKPSKGISFAYVGALGASYDLETVIKVFSLPQFRSVKLFIFGTGPSLNFLKSIASENILFEGFIPFDQLERKLNSINVLINPIKKFASQSITNKLSDYIVLNKPIISSQFSEEIITLFSNWPHYHLYDSENEISFKQVLINCLETYKNSSCIEDNELSHFFSLESSYKYHSIWLDSNF